MRKVAVLAVLLLLTVQPVHAQVPERTPAFVYGINAVTPGSVVGTFAPPSVEAIYLQAHEFSLISPRRTMIYFWPITNSYRAAWSELNELIEGVLEIRRGPELVTTVELSDYTIHLVDRERGVPTPEIYVGEAAIAAHERFEAARDQYQQAVLDYQRLRSEWLSRPDPSSEDEPLAPEPLRTHSTGLNRGFPINLAAGTYEITLRREDGTTPEGGTRRLVTIEPRRVATGYHVIPEARWTMPEEVTDPSDAILGRRGSVIYLQPRTIYEFPALEYELLTNPQYPGDIPGALWNWVTGEFIEDAVMEVLQGGEVIDRVPLAQYRVTQTPGTALGYEISPLHARAEVDDPREPDFVGYRIELSDALDAFSVRLVRSDGEVIVGSERQVRAIAPTDIRLLLLVIPLPILTGALVISVRQRRTARLRMVG